MEDKPGRVPDLEREDCLADSRRAVVKYLTTWAKIGWVPVRGPTEGTRGMRGYGSGLEVPGGDGHGTHHTT